jgi:hypothetical protein
VGCDRGGLRTVMVGHLPHHGLSSDHQKAVVRPT